MQTVIFRVNGIKKKKKKQYERNTIDFCHRPARFIFKNICRKFKAIHLKYSEK